MKFIFKSECNTGWIRHIAEQNVKSTKNAKQLEPKNWTIRLKESNSAKESFVASFPPNRLNAFPNTGSFFTFTYTRTRDGLCWRNSNGNDVDWVSERVCGVCVCALNIGADLIWFSRLELLPHSKPSSSIVINIIGIIWATHNSPTASPSTSERLVVKVSLSLHQFIRIVQVHRVARVFTGIQLENHQLTFRNSRYLFLLCGIEAHNLDIKSVL